MRDWQRSSRASRRSDLGRRRPLRRELVRRGLADDEDHGARLVASGRVTVAGGPATNPDHQVSPAESVTVHPPAPDYVSRGGAKLAHALDTFDVAVAGWRCLDAGASTGGFTDCLLQHGAAAVVAVDVGYGVLHQRLRDDPRVTVMERTNVRSLTPDALAGGPVDLVVADLAFIGLSAVLPALRALARPGGEAVVLVKPQFEAAAGQVGPGGVVTAPSTWDEVLHRVADAATAIGWGRCRVTPSPLLGPAGNVEFLAHLEPGTQDAAETRRRIAAAVTAGRALRDGGAGSETSADAEASA